jgi:2'-5' RNA ligase
MAEKHQVLELHFDPKVELIIAELRQKIYASFSSAKPDAGQCAPHVSLTSSTGISVLSRAEEIKALCAAQDTFELTFSFLGFFRGRGATLFLGLTPTIELLQFHRDLHGLLDGKGITQADFIRPSVFVPHCSLAVNLDAKQELEACEAAQNFRLPLTAVAATLQLVEYFPAKTLEVFPFKAKRSGGNSKSL